MCLISHSLRYSASVAAVFLSLVACTPTHFVKPLPNFVDVALAPGDRVTVTMHDGASHEFVITDVRGDILVGSDGEYALRDIASIRKHAWKRPESPCGGEKPLGCSVPLLVGLTSESHSHYGNKFYDACAQHDYCYRHGASTYGMDRQGCDDEFLLDMQNICPDPPEGGLGKFLGAMDGSVSSRHVCLSVANDFYAAVRRYGEDKFQTVGSSYCEYNGAPVRANTLLESAARSR